MSDKPSKLKIADREFTSRLLVGTGKFASNQLMRDALIASGTATVMPLGSPIGSNRGIETRPQIEIIIEQATVPVVVDAGLGAPSQAAEAMEMGADAVLVNTAIAIASDPVRMAQAFRKAIEAGREAWEIGMAEKLAAAAATSPLTGFLATER